MEVGQQIKKQRQQLQLSQEELAEKIYVSRQTISNWETEKSYPDLQSLILLSQCFKLTLDQLIKGDLEEMKQVIKQEDIKEMNKATRYMIGCMIAILLLVFPAFYYLGWWGLLIYLPLLGLGVHFANRIEKIKKNNQVQTYRQIVAFSQGETLSETETIAENAKYPYQKPLIVLTFTGIFAILAMLVSLIYVWLLP